MVTNLRRKIIAPEKAEWRGAKHYFRTQVYSDNAMYIRTPPKKAAWCTKLQQIYALKIVASLGYSANCNLAIFVLVALHANVVNVP